MNTAMLRRYESSLNMQENKRLFLAEKEELAEEKFMQQTFTMQELIEHLAIFSGEEKEFAAQLVESHLEDRGYPEHEREWAGAHLRENFDKIGGK